MRIRITAFIFMIALLVPSFAAGTTFSESQTLTIIADNPLPGGTTPPVNPTLRALFPLGGTMQISSSYQDDNFSSPQCLGPGANCNLIGSDAQVNIDLTILIGQTFTEADFEFTDPFMIPAGNNFLDISNPRVPFPPATIDRAGISALNLNTFPSLNNQFGPGNRFSLELFVINVLAPAGTLPDPLDFNGFNFYTSGPDRTATIGIWDSQTQTLEYVFVQNPEPGTAILMGLGLMGLSHAGRRKRVHGRPALEN